MAPVAWPRGGMGGNCPPPLFSKDGPRDSFKIEEKIAGYRFGKIFPRNGRLSKEEKSFGFCVFVYISCVFVYVLCVFFYDFLGSQS